MKVLLNSPFIYSTETKQSSIIESKKKKKIIQEDKTVEGRKSHINICNLKLILLLNVDYYLLNQMWNLCSFCSVVMIFYSNIMSTL